MARIPDSEIERLKKEISIERLVTGFGIELKRHGAELIGRCPFHEDHTPSLVVSPRTNLWHCLGACNIGGSTIDWVMKTRGVSFRHAVELLRADHPSLAAGLSSGKAGHVVRKGTTAKLPSPVALDADEQQTLRDVVCFYRETLKESPEALRYLESRGLTHPEMMDRFQLGFANRKLGLTLPDKNRKAGADLRGRLQRFGILRESGHEHFNGSLIIPIFDLEGNVLGMYGRKITPGLREGTPLHLYLPGPHRGVWNEEALQASREIILCESLIDALTFWCAGFRNVTASYGVNGFTEDHKQAFARHGVREVWIAYDRDEAGDTAAERLKEELTAMGIESHRVLFPKGLDANEYACKGESLAVLLNRSEKPPAPAPQKPTLAVNGDEIVVHRNDRRYRIRGLQKNLSPEVMKVNVLVSRQDGFHVDTLDMQTDRQRAAFIKRAAEELGSNEEVIRKDIGQVFLALEQLQSEQIRKALEPAKPEVALTEEERTEALALLKDPKLLDRILEDFDQCGLVGEATNKLIGYLAAVSRHLESPLAVVVQSSSAAGKSSLMDAVLQFVPEEERIQYSAMTGQSLYYMGEMDLKHKVLAIVEEEGASRATYALKLLQSEGSLSIASTGKDPATGKLVTHQYRVEGPVMMFLTTTAIEGSPTQWSYPITYTAPLTNGSVVAGSCVTDSGAAAERCWTFGNGGSTGVAFTTGFSRWGTVGGTMTQLRSDALTYSPDGAGNPIMIQDLTTDYTGASGNVYSQTEQAVDQYGNTTSVLSWDYSTSLPGSTPTRTVTTTYKNNCSSPWTGSTANDCPWVNLFLLSLPLQTTLTAGSANTALASNIYDTYTKYALVAAPGVYELDSFALNIQIPRGNVTQSVRPGSTTNYQFDITGMVVQADDNNGHAVSISAASGMNNTVPGNIQPNTGSSGDSSLATALSYTPFLGVSSAAAPNESTASTTYDSAGRVSTTQVPSHSTDGSVAGATTTYAYAFGTTVGGNITNGAYTTTATTGTHWSTSVTDGLGRAATQTTGYGTTSPTTVSTVDTVYGPCACSPAGKMVQTSQPYAPGGTEVWSVYTYDYMGRTLTVTLPDGASTTKYTYQGNWTTVVDPAGKWKQYQSDVFGNVVNVVEPDPLASPVLTTAPASPSTSGTGILVTSYTYDSLNHLVNVSMPRGSVTQTRTFTYDPVTLRLTSMTSPETGTSSSNGTTSYTYNVDGTLATRTDPKGQVTATLDSPTDNVLTTINFTDYWVEDYIYFYLFGSTYFLHDSYTYVQDVQAILNPVQPLDPNGQDPCGSCGGNPMAEYYFNPQMASLGIADTPISYTPPVGQPFKLHLTYSQTDTNPVLPQSTSNFGPNWSSNWGDYIIGGPASTSEAVASRYVPGGGQEQFINFSPVSTNYIGGFNGDWFLSMPNVKTSAAMYIADLNNTGPMDAYLLALPDGTFRAYFYYPNNSSILYLSSVTDPQGNSYLVNYSPGTTLISTITDPLGQNTTFTYGLASDPTKITAVTDPFGRSATFTYDSNNRLSSITDPVGIVSKFAYQGTTTFIQALTTPYGTTKFTTGTSVGSQFIQATDPLGQTERVEYDAQLDPSVVPASEPAVPAGVNVNNFNLNFYNSFYWDKQAYLAAEKDTVGSAAYYAAATATHWALGPNGVTAYGTSVKKPLENRVWTLFQGQSNPDYVDPSGTALPATVSRVLDDGTTQTTTKSYTPQGFVTQSIDPAGRQTNYSYGPGGFYNGSVLQYVSTNIDVVQASQLDNGVNDLLYSATYLPAAWGSAHEPLTTTDASGQTTTYTYNALNQPLTIADPLNETTTMVYDPQGYLLTVTGAIPGSTTTFSYDSAGRVQTVTDSEGYTITNAYDNINRLTTQTFPDTTTRQTVYDRLNIKSTTDRLGRTTTYVNDPLKRVIRITDPLSRVTNLNWCVCNKLAHLQDGNGNITTWGYDLESRLTSKTYANGKGDQFAYENTTSRLKSKTDAIGQVRSYQYAIDNNLLAINCANAQLPTPNVSFTYDPVYNRRVSMLDGTGSTAYVYNAVTSPPTLGATKLASVTGPLANSTIAYSYDALGRIAGRTINGSANPSTYAFDALDRPTVETNLLGTFTTAYVDETFRPASVTFPNGQITNYSYFNAVGDERLQQLQNLGNGGAVLSNFTYTYDAEGEILNWNVPTGDYTLAYDLASELTTAALAGSTPEAYGYTYDQAGNRTNETINGSAAPANVNNLNELTSRGGTAARVFAFDNDGDLSDSHGVSGGTTSYAYSWDAENRLKAITYPATNQVTEFSYDGLGRRVELLEKTGSTVNAVRQFIWDGLSIAEQRNSSDNVVKRFFSQGQINNGTSLFYTRDHLGSIREVANASGNLVTQYNYDPYGRRTVTKGTDHVDFGFTGHFYHAQSGLHLAPYRAYSADSGRWLSRDLYEIDGPNLYPYVRENPSTYIDPVGASTNGLALLSGGLQLTFPFIPFTPLVSGKIVGEAIVAGEINPIFAALEQRLRAIEKSSECDRNNGGPPVSPGPDPDPDSGIPDAPFDPGFLSDLAKDFANAGLANLYQDDVAGGWAAFALNIFWSSEPVTNAVIGVYH